MNNLTVVVTGASSGIGAAAAVGFARQGARVALVGRDPARLEETLSLVRAAAAPDREPRTFTADYEVLDDVRRLAAELAEAYPMIDVLCNNAGMISPTLRSTVDGHERTMQTNHLAPFLLTNLLRENLRNGRVVTTASDAHTGGALDPAKLDSSDRYRPFTAYGSSKQANILFAAEAARRWPDILSTSYHPGVVRTRFGRDSRLMSIGIRIAFFLRTPTKGADTMLWLAQTSRDELTNGGYYLDRKPATPKGIANDPKAAAILWESSAAAVGL